MITDTRLSTHDYRLPISYYVVEGGTFSVPAFFRGMQRRPHNAALARDSIERVRKRTPIGDKAVMLCPIGGKARAARAVLRAALGGRGQEAESAVE
jgi:hypothetical protein